MREAQIHPSRLADLPSGEEKEPPPAENIVYFGPRCARPRRSAPAPCSMRSKR
jgi:hypothetical protein